MDCIGDWIMDADEISKRLARHAATETADRVDQHWRSDRVYTSDVGETLLSLRQSELEADGSFAGKRTESFPRAAPGRELVRRWRLPVGS